MATKMWTWLGRICDLMTIKAIAMSTLTGIYTGWLAWTTMLPLPIILLVGLGAAFAVLGITAFWRFHMEFELDYYYSAISPEMPLVRWKIWAKRTFDNIWNGERGRVIFGSCAVCGFGPNVGDQVPYCTPCRVPLGTHAQWVAAQAAIDADARLRWFDDRRGYIKVVSSNRNPETPTP